MFGLDFIIIRDIGILGYWDLEISLDIVCFGLSKL